MATTKKAPENKLPKEETVKKPLKNELPKEEAVKKPQATKKQASKSTIKEPKREADTESDADDIKVELLPEDNDEVLTLTDDEGKSLDFFQIACIEYKHELYIILQPVEAIEGVDEDEAIILKMEEMDEEKEEDTFLPVHDEKLIDKLFSAYIKEVADSENR